jgi:acetyltransferase-like isoleucine patch superfamily enzyme
MQWVDNRGVNNNIIVENIINKKTRITIIGNNNSVVIREGCKLIDNNITIKGENIKLVFENNVELTGVIISLFTNTELYVGSSTTIGNSYITIAEECKISIGRDCMFAHNTEIRVSDMHPIYSLSDGSRINLGGDIYIGNHVWIGKNVTILKGVNIADNVVVGINSLVTKSINEKNTIAVGSPATIVKREVIWGRKMYHKTMYDDPTLVDIINDYTQELDGKLKKIKQKEK